MPDLPIVEIPTSRHHQKSRWAIPVHFCRVCLFVGILILIRQKHADFNSVKPDADRLSRIELNELSELIPDAVSVHAWEPDKQSRSVANASGKDIASLIQTSPASDSIVGYLGPTNLMLVLNPEQRILQARILESADTTEHVTAIREDIGFMESFIGLPWNRPEHWPEMDAVSGATLTSYAIMQGISSRAGLEKRVLKFPDMLTDAEIESCFGEEPLSNLVVLRTLKDDQLIQVMAGPSGEATLLGYVARTSPAADSLVGYQGPTDTVLILDSEMKLTGLKIRSSFDNKPYVGYVRDDSYLAELLAGKSLAEVASFPAEAYEGVSGATMTSLNVRDGVRFAASEISESLSQLRSRSGRGSNLALPWRDMTTVFVCVFGIVMGLTRLRTRKRMRFGYLVIVIVYLGFISGDMLSQALLVGWTQNGLPISVAPGLVFLCVAALIVPIVSKHNVYCGHLCPLGAMQQLSKNRIGHKFHLPRKLSHSLKLIPAVLLLFVLLTAFKQLDLNLASLEAFDAFSFRVAGWITICVALVGLTASLFVPMAYCRFGCPTGAVLSFFRFNANSGKIGARDMLAIGALALGLSL